MFKILTISTTLACSVYLYMLSWLWPGKSKRSPFLLEEFRKGTVRWDTGQSCSFSCVVWENSLGLVACVPPSLLSKNSFNCSFVQANRSKSLFVNPMALWWHYGNVHYKLQVSSVTRRLMPVIKTFCAPLASTWSQSCEKKQGNSSTGFLR